MIHSLILRVEAMLKHKLQTHSDFVAFSNILFDRTHERISPTTLRRLWGYCNEGVKPRRFTLDVLSRFILFRDFYDFCSNSQNQTVQSGICLGGKIESEHLFEGQLLRMSWLPDRCCVVEHLGHGRFRIVEAVNTKLSVGDTFTCHLFINNEPAYLDHLVHDGKGPLRYVAGRQSGVVVEKATQIQVG